MPEILVFAGIRDGVVSAPTHEVLGLARKIADATRDSVAVALLGANASSLTPDLAIAGADKVYATTHEALAEFDSGFWLECLEKIARHTGPSLVLFSSDETSAHLAPRLAHRLGAGLVTNCIAVEIRDGSVVATKPVYGGKALAAMKVHRPVAVLTVRQRTQERCVGDLTRMAELATVDPPEPHASPMVLLERTAEERKEISLEDARVVVSGGRGLGGAEPFDELKKMAALLDGAVGASRAAVDLGWMPPSHQIGQTGKIVAPTIYFAIAISGATQHVAGMSASKVIVAINADPHAPIFKVANLGVVDDYRNVVPTLIAELTRVLSK